MQSLPQSNLAARAAPASHDVYRYKRSRARAPTSKSAQSVRSRSLTNHAGMRAPFMRIPYTGPFPPPTIVPATARTLEGAVEALHAFVTGPPLPPSAISTAAAAADPAATAPASATTGFASRPRPPPSPHAARHGSTLLLTGAGISVASGLADYRGPAGTYTLNRSYRPIYHGEFVSRHAPRQRYWARSFLGWPNVARAGPNIAHRAVRALGELGVVDEVITQNVDSFHSRAHPGLATVELHGALRELECARCGARQDRAAFQADLARLNPAWAALLAEAEAAGALASEDPRHRAARGLRANPDGDVDLPHAPWSSFRYPACRACVEASPARAETDADGAWVEPAPKRDDARGGVLKPGVVMFGDSTRPEVRAAADAAVDHAARVLVVGSSLATYSAWRLVRRARDRGAAVGVISLGGVRGEDVFFEGVGGDGERGVRVGMAAELVLPALVEKLGGTVAE